MRSCVVVEEHHQIGDLGRTCEFMINARCKYGKSFTYNRNINITFTMDMDRGLITSILKGIERVDIFIISMK